MISGAGEIISMLLICTFDREETGTAVHEVADLKQQRAW